MLVQFAPMQASDIVLRLSKAVSHAMALSAILFLNVYIFFYINLKLLTIMERFLIIILSTELGLSPFICHLEDTSKLNRRVKTLINTCYKDKGPVYAEAYKVRNDGLSEFKKSYVFDGKSLFECDIFVPSCKSLKNFVENHSYPSLKL